MILTKNIKANYWEETIKIRKNKLEISEVNWKIIACDLVGKMKARKSIIIQSVKLDSQLKRSKRMIVKLNNKRIFRKIELCVSTRRMRSMMLEIVQSSSFEINWRKKGSKPRKEGLRGSNKNGESSSRKK
jgi:hypothetical protein